jgi:hypothetical protein
MFKQQSAAVMPDFETSNKKSSDLFSNQLICRILETIITHCSPEVVEQLSKSWNVVHQDSIVSELYQEHPLVILVSVFVCPKFQSCPEGYQNHQEEEVHKNVKENNRMIT